MQEILSSPDWDNFTSSFSFASFFLALLLLFQQRFSVLYRLSGHPILFLVLAKIVWICHIMLAVGLSYLVFIMLRYVTCTYIPNFFSVFCFFVFLGFFLS